MFVQTKSSKGVFKEVVYLRHEKKCKPDLNLEKYLRYLKDILRKDTKILEKWVPTLI